MGNTISLMKWINLSLSKGHWGIENVCFIATLQIENISNHSQIIKLILLNKYLQVLFMFLVYFSEKAMAPHSSTLAWKIPWMEEPGRLQSMGWLRVRYDWVTSLSLFTFMLWRRKWQPTPVFLPRESQGQGRLVGCRLWDHTESDTTEVT